MTETHKNQKIVSVILPLPFDKSFDYLVPDNLTDNIEIGSVVQVPFGKSEKIGIVTNDDIKSPSVGISKLKAIKQIFPHKIPETLIKFFAFIASYTISPLGLVYKLLLSKTFEEMLLVDEYTFKLNPDFASKLDEKSLNPTRKKIVDFLKKNPGAYFKNKNDMAKTINVSTSPINALIDIGVIIKEKTDGISSSEINYKYKAPQLNEEQANAVKALRDDIESNKFSATVLDGVTGSGKTEVYFNAAAKALEKERSVLILLPEIALTDQFFKKFKERFNTSPILWHSGLTNTQRRNNLQKIFNTQKNQKPVVIIGARSALFLSVYNLGLIVVDEEHDQTYKQDDSVTYNARDMAVVRASLEKCPIVLASATPSIESLINVDKGKYNILSLKSRFNDVLMPHIELVDMRKEKLPKNRWISKKLISLIKENLENKSQTLLYLNRKGYAPLNVCSECGERISCKFCSSYLVEHRKKGCMICHHCGHTEPKPEKCENCKSHDSFVACGPGVERIVEEISTLFPDARICNLTSDSFTSFTKLQIILEKIHNGEVDIIVGTQVLAKGHHFKNLTLVGIIDGDINGADVADIRANERSYQLLQQVSGRAGREMGQRGKVIIQTYKPESEVMQALSSGDKTTFIEYEKLIREYSKSPPFGRFTSVIISGPNQFNVESHARKIKNNFPQIEGAEIIGPTPAQMEMLRGKYRWRLLIKHQKPNIQQLIKAWNDNNKPADKHIKVQIDVDPYSFL